ncbi:hypothetical protein C8A03DRAFT_33559 [Achaetomium macrosporum]|uniref:Uncharacterized protein n=1 Tax=Achaetomium macrosporum TaxID=79813 RepID=A0AAN7CBU6_9PEZI|nr:hypothetical protein C8A03DRAFT_33559 [Achaetomium macrosporum]
MLFFTDAHAAAKEAQNREHLEELLGEKPKERRKELENVIIAICDAAFSLRTQFPSEAARTAASKVGRTSSLDSLVQSASGILWGWGDGNKDDKPADIGRLNGDNEGRADGSAANHQGPLEESGANHQGQLDDSGSLENDFTGTQDWEDELTGAQDWPSPAPVVSDWWDLAILGLDRRVRDLQETPGERRLSSPTSLRGHRTALGLEGRGSRDDVGRES